MSALATIGRIELFVGLKAVGHCVMLVKPCKLRKWQCGNVMYYGLLCSFHVVLSIATNAQTIRPQAAYFSVIHTYIHTSHKRYETG